ncbi:MAG: formylglycine-generating enzyme family protein [Capsulimonadaceae bacterium]
MQPVKYNPIDHAEMVFVPAGDFLMGGDAPMDDAKPQRRVHLDGYWIYKYPVTVEQYLRYCRENRLPRPERPGWGWRADHPIVNVSWDDAAAYCRWAAASLPTEAEWEKAARGTDGSDFPWGNEWDPERCQCSRKELLDAKGTAPVTSHPSGASPLGAMDMAGNVWEWCADWYADDIYRTAPNRNPQGPKTGTSRVVRGGGWYFILGGFFRCACRYWLAPAGRYFYSGFRAVVRPGSP